MQNAYHPGVFPTKNTNKKPPEINSGGFIVYFKYNYFSSNSSFFSSSFSGKMIDKRTEITNTPPTIPNETGDGI